MADVSEVSINDAGLYTRTYYTVATLPAAASMSGKELFCTDLSVNPQTNTGLTAAGGGSTRGRVKSDGTAWRLAGTFG